MKIRKISGIIDSKSGAKAFDPDIITFLRRKRKYTANNKKKKVFVNPVEKYIPCEEISWYYNIKMTGKGTDYESGNYIQSKVYSR